MILVPMSYIAFLDSILKQSFWFMIPCYELLPRSASLNNDRFKREKVEVTKGKVKGVTRNMVNSRPRKPEPETQRKLP